MKSTIVFKAGYSVDNLVLEMCTMMSQKIDLGQFIVSFGLIALMIFIPGGQYHQKSAFHVASTFCCGVRIALWGGGLHIPYSWVKLGLHTTNKLPCLLSNAFKWVTPNLCSGWVGLWQLM